MTINNFIIYQSPFPKIRVGRRHDGGYIIADILGEQPYDFFISGGISCDISYEVDFLNRHNYLQSHNLLYDGSVPGLPPMSQYINPHTELENLINHSYLSMNFRKTFMNNRMNEEYKNVFRTCENIFIKMDIEGGEYELFHPSSMTDEELNRISQITIEFHWTHHRAERMHIFERFLKNHTMIHFHANNCGKMEEYQGVPFPEVFECTFLHNKYFTSPRVRSYEGVPTVLDDPNNNTKKDYLFSANWPTN
jgi:hypothetical protein